MHRLLLGIGVVAFLTISCSKSAGECLALPCPLPLAAVITVTSSASSAPVSGAFVQEYAPGVSSPVPCSGTTCYVMGSAGSYQLDIGAPGFTTVHLTVQVQGTNAACGCGTVDTAHLAVALVSGP